MRPRLVRLARSWCCSPGSPTAHCLLSCLLATTATALFLWKATVLVLEFNKETTISRQVGRETDRMSLQQVSY